MALVNLAEDIIRERLDELLKTYDCCKCEYCYTDMLALSLNLVKPMYVNTLQGQLIKRCESHKQQNSVDLDIAVIKAIEIVHHNPHHPSTDEN